MEDDDDGEHGDGQDGRHAQVADDIAVMFRRHHIGVANSPHLFRPRDTPLLLARGVRSLWLWRRSRLRGWPRRSGRRRFRGGFGSRAGGRCRPGAGPGRRRRGACGGYGALGALGDASGGRLGRRLGIRSLGRRGSGGGSGGIRGSCLSVRRAHQRHILRLRSALRGSRCCLRPTGRMRLTRSRRLLRHILHPCTKLDRRSRKAGLLSPSTIHIPVQYNPDAQPTQARRPHGRPATLYESPVKRPLRDTLSTLQDERRERGVTERTNIQWD